MSAILAASLAATAPAAATAHAAHILACRCACARDRVRLVDARGGGGSLRASRHRATSVDAYAACARPGTMCANARRSQRGCLAPSPTGRAPHAAHETAQLGRHMYAAVYPAECAARPVARVGARYERALHASRAPLSDGRHTTRCHSLILGPSVDGRDVHERGVVCVYVHAYTETAHTRWLSSSRDAATRVGVLASVLCPVPPSAGLGRVVRVPYTVERCAA